MDNQLYGNFDNKLIGRIFLLSRYPGLKEKVIPGGCITTGTLTANFGASTQWNRKWIFAR